MPVCYLLPGFFGTELYFDPFRLHKLWVSYTSLALGWIGAARLSADGVSPGAPDGEVLFHADPLEDYFTEAYLALVASMRNTGYDFIPWGYDWRHTIPNGPTALALDIQRRITPGDPCTIVAFSLGGLQSRATWAELVRAGASHLVRRVVTVGSPHQGSYVPVQVWSGDYDFIYQLCLLSAAAPVLNLHKIPGSPALKLPSQLIQLAATWPSMYCALPLLGGTEAESDPNRAALFVAENWPASREVQQQWLTLSHDVTGPFLRSSESMPPPWVLTTIAGGSIPTVGQLAYPQQLGNSAAYSAASDGDGVVTVGSGLVEDSRAWLISGRHNDLPLLVARNGLLAQSILEVRVAPQPPPPQEEMAATLTPLLAGPPVPRLAFGTPIPYRPGDC